MSREEYASRDLVLDLFKHSISRDSKSCRLLERDLFRKYAIFTQSSNNFFYTVSDLVKMSKSTGLENRLTFETICYPLDLSFEEDVIGDERLDFSTKFICTGSVYVPEEEALITATSFSMSNYFDDTTFYDDFRGISHTLDPSVVIDIFRDDDLGGVFSQADKPLRIQNEELLLSNPLLRYNL